MEFFDMHETAEKFEGKTVSKTCYNDFQLLHMVKIARLENAFSKSFKLEASPVEGQSPPQKDKQRGKRKAKKKKKNRIKKKKKTQKPKDVGSTKFGFQRIPEQKCRKT